MDIGHARIEEHLLQTLHAAILADRLTLPTLPESAMRLLEMRQDDDIGPPELTQALARDAATASTIIRIANSAAYRAATPIDSLRGAILRLGVDTTCTVAMGFAMEQMFHARSPVVDRMLRQAWVRGQEVAALAHVLALHYTELNPELALLAGLVHEIGVLPILRLADDHPSVAHDPRALVRLIDTLHPRVGSMVLHTWKFPSVVARVPAHYGDFSREHEGPPDYVDLITVAVLQSARGRPHPLSDIDCSSVSAFDRIGLDAGVDAIEMLGASEELRESRAMVGMA